MKRQDICLNDKENMMVLRGSWCSNVRQLTPNVQVAHDKVKMALDLFLLRG